MANPNAIPPRTPGGRRKGGGRKKKFETILKEAELEANITEAKKSLKLIEQIRDNHEIMWNVRLDAAKYRYEVVFGKPKQSTDLTSGGESLLKLLAEFHDAAS